MVNWHKVKVSLLKHCPEGIETLEEALEYLYNTKEYSLEKIVSLTDRELLSTSTLSIKLIKLGFKIRPRGGENALKEVPIKLTDFEFHSARELARKYDVDVGTIYNKKKLLKEPIHH